MNSKYCITSTLNIILGFKSVFLIQQCYCDAEQSGLASLEYRCYDSRLAMFYKIQYGLVAEQMPSYFEHPKRITHHSQYNPLCFRQVFASTDYYRCLFYPMKIVLWNLLPSEIVLLPDLDFVKREVSKIK